MKFSISAAFVFAAISANLVSARPLFQKQARQASTTPVGAAYFITNGASGNMIMTANVLPDGRLSCGQAVKAGGLGLAGASTPANGPDSLFSQGAVKVNQAGNMLATLNPGSNTISLFSIDPTNPSNITMVGMPVGSGGEFPNSLAINANGTQVCALNSGSTNGVQCFNVDMQLGLTSQPNTLRLIGLNQTTPPSGPANTPGHVIYSADGSQLIATVKGVPPMPGFLATWDVLPGGALSAAYTKSVPAPGGALPFSATVIPGTTAILATDAFVGASVFDFSQGGNAATSTIIPIPNQKATCWSAFSQATGNFYVTDVDSSMMTELNINNQTLAGTVVAQYPMAPGSGLVDLDILTINGMDYAYINQANVTSVQVMALTAPGKAQYIETFDVSECAAVEGVPLTAGSMGMTSFVIPTTA